MKSQTNIKRTALNLLITSGFILAAFWLSFFLKISDSTYASAPMFFILSVFIISRLTHGYIYGILASLSNVLIADYFFTYPYYEFNLTLSGYPVFFVCMLVISIATTKITNQNKQQEKTRIESEREKTRSNLLRAVSHDLRTPLTAINGACSVMIENDDFISKEKRIKLLNEIIDDSGWLIRMVENLLSITRIDAENARIVKTQEAIEEVIADSVSKFKKQYPSINIIAQIPSELVLIPMDVILIEQVLINLLENAVIHSNTATEIRLSVNIMSDCVEFSVSDNGNGIPEDILPHIFDGYFNKTYEENGDAKRSMGIGLSVCNTIIKAHGGTMSAKNKKSGGAIFTFTLPAGEE